MPLSVLDTVITRRFPAFLLAYLNVADYYITHSEEEMGKGYADLYLEPFFPKYPDIRYTYLIEIKYIPRKKWTVKLQEQHRDDARTQLQQYAGDDRVIRNSRGATLKCVVLVFNGWEMTLAEEVEVGERRGAEEQRSRRAEEQRSRKKKSRRAEEQRSRKKKSRRAEEQRSRRAEGKKSRKKRIRGAEEQRRRSAGRTTRIE